MGDGTEQNPYTREDVIRLIEENGGDAKGLNLSNYIFERKIDLSGLNLNLISFRRRLESSIQKIGRTTIFASEVDLTGANFQGTKLLEADFGGAVLIGANFDNATLNYAHFDNTILYNASFYNADLQGTHFEGAILNNTDLRNTNLEGANLERAELNSSRLSGALLYGIKISSDTSLLDVKWNDYIIREERDRQFGWAVETYRRLKVWYTTHGIYDVAGEFFYREMECKRQAVKFSLKHFDIHHIWLIFFNFLCGYGERPWRVLRWSTLVISIFTIIYFLISFTLQWSAFWHSLYFSTVSFTALGYGSWIDRTWFDTTNDWIIGLGAFESFIGIFSMALFAVTFTRKITR